MVRPAERRRSSSSRGWAALGWSALAMLAAGVFGALALPGTTPGPFTNFERSDFLRPEWLVVATLLAYPAYLAARSHWLTALPVVIVLSAESWFVVDTGLDSLHQVGMSAPVPDGVLIGSVALQAAVFVAAAGLGGWRNRERCRWLRRMRRMIPELADADAVGSPTTDWASGR